MSKKQIIGAGGGSRGKSSRTAVEDPDSLHSHQYAQVIDLVSEGPIKGLVNGLRSVYLDDTPIVAADGSSNVKGVTLVERLGTNDQAPVDGFASVDNETLVNVEVNYGEPVVRTISGDIDSATVTIDIPQLTKTDLKTGDMHGSSVALHIELQNNGGGFQPVPLDYVWSGFSGEGVFGQTIAIDNSYGIGIAFTVTAGVTSMSYTGASDGGGNGMGDYGGDDGPSGDAGTPGANAGDGDGSNGSASV